MYTTLLLCYLQTKVGFLSIPLIDLSPMDVVLTFLAMLNKL